MLFLNGIPKRRRVVLLKRCCWICISMLCCFHNSHNNNSWRNTIFISANEATDRTNEMLALPQDIETIVTLTDESFEHTTQASTGQTTGSWLVWFYSNSKQQEQEQQQPITFVDSFPPLETWLEQHVIVASIHADTVGSQTTKRFGIETKQLPSFVYFHKGQMYLIPQTTTNTYSWATLLEFCRNPDPNVARAIPSPPDWMDIIIFKLANDKYLLTGTMVMIMVIGAFIGSVVENFFPPKTPQQSTTSIPKKGKTIKAE
jgi:hypothetical protein